jgi:hypothetical protein
MLNVKFLDTMVLVHTGLLYSHSLPTQLIVTVVSATCQASAFLTRKVNWSRISFTFAFIITCFCFQCTLLSTITRTENDSDKNVYLTVSVPN